MITFIAFVLTILGCINWLLIGLLQYDFIAGLFGYQANIFSRLCYIIIGIGCLYLIIRVIVNKGSVKVFERKQKKKQKDVTSEDAWANLTKKQQLEILDEIELKRKSNALANEDANAINDN